MVAVVTGGHGHAANAATTRSSGTELFRPLPEGSVELALAEAYGACVERWGRSKTTMGDVAREAGVSRATVYRIVPSKDALHDLHRRHGLAAFFADLDAELPDDGALDELLVAALSAASRLIGEDEGFQRLLVDDPGAVLPSLTFRGLDRIFAACRVFIAPRLEAHLGPPAAIRTAEWLARLVLWPVLDERAPFDLTDPDQVRDLVERRLLPALSPHSTPPTTSATGVQEES
ncbi:MAG: TetR/AcrR family transcriptional regulator [Actinomycetota bacterium]